MLEQRQHFILNYLTTASVAPARNQTRVSRTVDWHLNEANEANYDFTAPFKYQDESG